MKIDTEKLAKISKEIDSKGPGPSWFLVDSEDEIAGFGEFLDELDRFEEESRKVSIRIK